MISCRKNQNQTYTMIPEQIRACLAEHRGTFVFDYRNKRYGIEPYSDTELEIWHEDKTVMAGSLDEVMRTPFFDGKALSDIAEKIEILEW